ncbi:MAG: DNA modification methylase [Planctomycetales bacterium]|nr:DNA modification methylase [Planctomycetales bacterium]
MQVVPIATLRLHPEADRVPQMNVEQAAEFQADIAERGIRVPIEIVGTQIVDGRSRFLAAKKLGIEQVPVIDAPLHGDDPVLYMLRAATRRRHLTDDQRACLAEEEREYLAERSRRERARAGGLAGGRGRTKASVDSSAVTLAGELSRDRSGDARAIASKTFGVSERSIRYAQKLKSEAPRLYEQVKAGNERLSIAKRQMERDVKRRQQREQSQQVETTTGYPLWQISCGDCLTELAKIAPSTVRLIFADSPYNIGIDYGAGAKADRLTDEQYLAWCRRWMGECARLLTVDGSLWVMINDEYADHFGLLLRETGLIRRSWIKWYETFGVNCTNNFNRCSRHIFYCVKDAKKFVFNADAVSRPSDRLTKYHDRRADPGGKLWDNVWCIPRLVENSAERLPDFPTQLPLELLRAVIGCASHPGDTVLDPFSGSGTTGIAAIEGARRFIGIERNHQFAELSRERLASHRPEALR